MQLAQGPVWTTSNVNTIKGEDHLGIRFVGISIADTLQSGITSITPRARYWSFFAWVLYDFLQYSSSEKSLKEFKRFLKTQEWFYILSNIGWAVKSKTVTNALIGSKKGVSAWVSNQSAFEPVLDYVKDSFGGYGTYRNVMKIIGLTRESNADKGVQIDRLTPFGKELAESFENTIKGTAYYQRYRHSDVPIPRDVLVEYGSVAGLSSMKFGVSKDLPILINLFIPKEPKSDRARLRKQSLLYYMNIINQLPGQKMSFKIWQKTMYDGYYHQKLQLPKELQTVAIGWEIYHARQMFTYSLDSMWSYVLDLMSRRIYTTSELITHVLDELTTAGYDLNQNVHQLGDLIPLHPDTRQEYVQNMSFDERGVVTHIWDALLVLLDVRSRLQNRSEFNEMHSSLLKLGGRESISFKSWDLICEQYQDELVSDFVSYILKYYILDQHQKVALNKIITTKNDTYHFVENDGKLYFISDDRPTFNVFRVNQGLTILEDLQLIKGINGSFSVTPYGQVNLNENS
ncbi:hypothetical protein [Bacillus sp. T3]|uniref:hypothetical protein n=1 Tax=Bacillus sp. T3 TaxID=467262 RepID=UPI00298103E4|nr:hypothetical protein [Bacillus sp. T3]